MVHLDAHPDMSASSTMPAETVFADPRGVYFAMRGDASGIAQWILPAVYGGHLRTIWWVRPTWAEQIADGDYDVYVGRAPSRTSIVDDAAGRVGEGKQVSRCRDAVSLPRALPATPGAIPVAAETSCGDGASRAEDASVTSCGADASCGDRGTGPALVPPQPEKPAPETIHISCAAPYFVEDGLYCEEDDLISEKPLRFLVSPSPQDCVSSSAVESATDLVGSAIAATAGTGQWILDVCLDYFACGNPFLTHVRPHIAAPFAAVQNAALYRQGTVDDVPRFFLERDAFDAAYYALLRAAIANAAGSGMETASSVVDEHGRHQSEEPAADADASASEGGSSEDCSDDEFMHRALLRTLVDLLPAERRSELLGALRAAIGDAHKHELQEIMEAGDMVTLPLHPTTNDEVTERLRAFEAFLSRLDAAASAAAGAEAASRLGSPSVVTIARSVVDGFCPMRWHCALEQGVMDVLRRRYGDLHILYSDELDALESAPVA
eukprot:TRINITY_DN28834_c1_g2_i1.p1 TRINITY_DN28834_c1_g2~~TRINITY_DN28834_c1_g2_i1.p1  ORF type:complete len:578 (-),score=103.60 TRINITY_DN28834_c1_g2_i1:42-1523(-)